MLIQVRAEEVAAAWDMFKPMILASLPPTATKEQGTAVEILQSVLEGKSTMWAFKREEEVVAVLLTTEYYDQVLRTKSLLIYAIYGIAPITMSVWVEGLETLRKFAKTKGQGSIIFYSNNKPVIRLMAQLGANCDFVLGEFKVDGGDLWEAAAQME